MCTSVYKNINYTVKHWQKRNCEWTKEDTFRYQANSWYFLPTRFRFRTCEYEFPRRALAKYRDRCDQSENVSSGLPISAKSYACNVKRARIKFERLDRVGKSNNLHTFRGEKRDRSRESRNGSVWQNTPLLLWRYLTGFGSAAIALCIRTPRRMHSSRLVYVINKVSEQTRA